MTVLLSKPRFQDQGIGDTIIISELDKKERTKKHRIKKGYVPRHYMSPWMPIPEE